MLTLLLAAWLQAESRDAILDRLEARAKTVERIHAEFELKNLPGITRLALDCESGKWIHFTIDRKEGPTGHYLLENWKRYQWTAGETGIVGDFQPWFVGMEKGLNEVIQTLNLGGTEASPGALRTALGLGLEGKPAKDEMGSFRFYCGFSGSRFAWLGDLRKETAAETGGEGDQIVFRIPARWKTVTLYRDSGFLKSIETKDYDGTARSVECRSYVLNGTPAEKPRPPECRRAPISRDELDEVMSSRQTTYSDLLTLVFKHWDQVVARDGTAAVAKAYAREVGEQAGLWREIRLHQLAAWAIRTRLDRGESWASLKQSAAEDGVAFGKFARVQADLDYDGLKKSFEEGQDGVESKFKECAPQGSDPAKFRALLRSALDLDAVWKKLWDGAAGRSAEVYGEELENARSI